MLAGADRGPAAGETPRLYTNADLPPPTTSLSSPPARTDDAANWALVQSVLDREAARIESERRAVAEHEASLKSVPDPGPPVWRNLPWHQRTRCPERPDLCVDPIRIVPDTPDPKKKRGQR